MRLGKSLLRRYLAVSPGESPMGIGAGGYVPQAGEISNLSECSRHFGKRRSQHIFES
jgi:hypothetical protein